MRVSLNDESQARWIANAAEHLRYEYDLKPDDFVFDIGSYRGEWAAEIYRRYGCRIIGIEPTPYNAFEHFERFINKAASDCEGEVAFGGAYYYSSSHEEPAGNYPCFDLNPVLAEYPEIALCKINVEADEYTILPHVLSANLHLRIRDFQIQFHQIQGEPFEQWYNLIVTELCKSHYSTWPGFSYCWENWRRKE